MNMSSRCYIEPPFKDLICFIDVLVIAAGHVTEPFEDWVAGHGELWSAQLLAAAVRQVQNHNSKLSLRICHGGCTLKINNVSLMF